MALYVYRCEECGAEVEEFRAMDKRDDGTPLCSTCSVPMYRVQQPTPHRWTKNGANLRAPGKEWNWPEGKPFEPREFVERNPSSREAVTKRAHELARTPNRE